MTQKVSELLQSSILIVKTQIFHTLHERYYCSINFASVVNTFSSKWLQTNSKNDYFYYPDVFLVDFQNFTYFLNAFSY